MAKRKTILFGGTFDPIHLGHTTVAACAAERIGADNVVFVPAKRSPLKQTPHATDSDRLKMIALAIQANKNFQLSDYELKKDEPGFTIDTVKHFQAELGNEVAICWLVGADSIGELSKWYKIIELIDLCDLFVMYRAGCEKPYFRPFSELWGADRVQKLQKNVIETPLIDISSTEIREKIASGADVTDMLESRIVQYITNHNLYKPKANH